MSRHTRRAALLGVAAAALITGITAAPALAYGSGQSQVQPGGGCNSGTYYYRSDARNDRANAFTSFDGYCWGNKTAGAQPIADSKVGPWAYSVANVSTSMDKPAGSTVHGNHTINGGYARST
ncbi:hypothetical protein C5C31_04930 [Rathayibacter rathayi]|uniref:Lactococcin 972 family bacteriocin n=1 Tax=Rathayibacter rathayi TaxID=33887 RepID=A0ABD6W8F9_RATRA|nr:hypothetical protein [Rathayibacter rathayi]AZZ48302.1 hypothetical protein C1O28_03010 [Rathayibacter rathayi]MWV74196.1 hypothetical protein [Rathayibacter rathayi NCPPB 2980 = VKM Ac-1601]PPF14166.1 hypothetical protein C5C04_07735 [Rathayibacter rathayi]PPF24039.1 hypothetical protein C5C34_06685 [Rathayibacter rathayi]PPF48966.1 hypothetical protein C5C08_08070 [Rathayibacter rathayi]